MRCLDDCHNYELDLFMKGREDLPIGGESLRFYEMREDGTIINGVINEEVLRVLIHRMMRLNEKLYCMENRMVINHLSRALDWLGERTKDRTARKVEGTHKP